MTATGRRALLVLALAMLAGTTAAAAWADPPAKDVFFDSFTFQDTLTCPGVTITQHNEERDTITEFSPTKLRVQRHGVATLSANGKTLTSNFSAQIFQGPRRPVKVTGTVYNIQVPDAGPSCSTPGTSSSTSRPPADGSPPGGAPSAVLGRRRRSSAATWRV